MESKPEFEIWEEFSTQGAVCVKEMGFDCTDRSPQPTSDVFQGEILFVTQNKHGSLAGRQGWERGV